MELLSAKRVQSFQSVRQEEVLHLIRTFSLNATAPVNLSEKIHSLTYGVTSRVAFGKKFKDQEAFISIIKELVQLAAGFSVAELYPSVKLLALISGIKPKLEKLQREADRILNIVNEHKEREATTKTAKREAGEDLVDVLLKIQEHGDLEFPLTGDNIKPVILCEVDETILNNYWTLESGSSRCLLLHLKTEDCQLRSTAS